MDNIFWSHYQYLLISSISQSCRVEVWCIVPSWPLSHKRQKSDLCIPHPLLSQNLSPALFFMSLPDVGVYPCGERDLLHPPWAAAAWWSSKRATPFYEPLVNIAEIRLDRYTVCCLRQYDVTCNPKAQILQPIGYVIDMYHRKLVPRRLLYGSPVYDIHPSILNLKDLPSLVCAIRLFNQASAVKFSPSWQKACGLPNKRTSWYSYDRIQIFRPCPSYPLLFPRIWSSWSVQNSCINSHVALPLLDILPARDGLSFRAGLFQGIVSRWMVDSAVHVCRNNTYHLLAWVLGSLQLSKRTV